MTHLFCGELCFVHVTAPGKKMNTLAGFAQLALHVMINRHPSVSKSADIMWTIPRTGGLKIRVFALFHLVLPLKLHSSKANAGKTCCIKASHVKGCLQVISNTRICAPYYVWTTRVRIATMAVFSYYEAKSNILTCDKYSTPSRPSLWPV